MTNSLKYVKKHVFHKLFIKKTLILHKCHLYMIYYREDAIVTVSKNEGIRNKFCLCIEIMLEFRYSEVERSSLITLKGG